MADTSNLSNFLSDIAEAIRTKKETIDTIPAKDFDTEILSIETGINTSDATATAANIENGYTAYVNGEKISGSITTSLDTIITAGSDATITDTGEALTVDRGYGEKIVLKEEQQLRSTIPYNTLASIGGVTADKIVSGNTIFGVTGTAETGSGTEINNQDKTITENGTYSADEGYTGLGEVTVNVQADGVKQFPTIDDMQKDTTAEEGDLAIVYADRLETIPNLAIPIGELIHFPATVTLDAAITEEYTASGYVDTSDLTLTLNASGFTFQELNWDTGGTTITYTSTDGITYTRTSTTESLTLTSSYGETVVSWSSSSTGLDYMSNFVRVIKPYFEGLFEYAAKRDSSLYEGYINPRVVNSTFTYDELVGIPAEQIEAVAEVLTSSTDLTDNNYDQYLVIKKSDTLFWCYTCLQDSSSSPWWSLASIYNNGITRYIAASYVQSETPKFMKVVVDLSTNSYTMTEIAYTTYDYQRVCETFSNTDIITSIYTSDVGDSYSDYIGNIQVFGTNEGTDPNNTNYVDTKIYNLLVTKYYAADSQLTLSNANELLPDVTAFGATGVITGDESIYDNLDKAHMLSEYYGAENMITSGDTNYTYCAHKDFYHNQFLSTRTDKLIRFVKLSKSLDSSNVLGVHWYEGQRTYDIASLDGTYHYTYNNTDLKLTLIDTTDGTSYEYSYTGKYGFARVTPTHFVFGTVDSTTVTLYVYSINLETKEVVSNSITMSASGFTNKKVQSPYYDIVNDEIHICWHGYSSSNLVYVKLMKVSVSDLQFTEIGQSTLSAVSSSNSLLVDTFYTNQNNVYIIAKIYGSSTWDYNYQYSLLKYNLSTLIYSVVKTTQISSQNYYYTDSYRYCNSFGYEDDSYLYFSGYQINKSTLAHTTVQTTEYPMLITYDGTFGLSDNGFGDGSHYISVFDGYDLSTKRTLNYFWTIWYTYTSSSGTVNVSSSGATFQPINKTEDGHYQIISINNSGQIFIGTLYTVEDVTQPDAEYMIVPVGAHYRPIYSENYYSNQYFISKLGVMDSTTVDYTGTISPTEYEEINAIAEDVLGGVE